MHSDSSCKSILTGCQAFNLLFTIVDAVGYGNWAAAVQKQFESGWTDQSLARALNDRGMATAIGLYSIGIADGPSVHTARSVFNRIQRQYTLARGTAARWSGYAKSTLCAARPIQLLGWKVKTGSFFPGEERRHGLDFSRIAEYEGSTAGISAVNILCRDF